MDEDIELAESIAYRLNQVVDGGFIREIGLQSQHIQARPSKLLRRHVCIVRGGVIVDDEVVTALRQHGGDMPANAFLAAAGHEGDTSLSHEKIRSCFTRT